MSNPAYYHETLGGMLKDFEKGKGQISKVLVVFLTSVSVDAVAKAAQGFMWSSCWTRPHAPAGQNGNSSW